MKISSLLLARRFFAYPSLLLAVFLGGMYATGGLGYAALNGSAAVILEPSLTESPMRGLVSVKVLVSTKNPLNAYRVGIEYPEDRLEFVRFETKDSIVNLWQTEPKGDMPGLVEIVGGSTNAFTGDGGLLGTVVFRTRTAGSATLSVPRPEIYLADGLGSKAEVSAVSLMLTITNEIAPLSGEKPDEAPPEVLQIAITDDPFNDAQKIVGVTAEDVGGGIRKTFAREKTGLMWSSWAQVDRSFAVHKNAWAIAVKTIDNAGNEAQRVIYEWPLFFSNVLAPLLLLIGVVTLMWFTLRKRTSRA